MANNNFDPDAYLAKKTTTQSQFDPDAYLKKKTPIAMSEALALGGFQGLSLGFVDELSGRLEQLGSVFGRRGWGTEPIFQGRPETPDEQKESLAEVYAKGRDIRRKREAAAKKEYPIAYPVAEFAGGMAAPIGAGTAAKSFLGAAAKGFGSGAIAGGLQAAGTTEAETGGEIAKEALGGAATGAIFGAGAGLVGRGLTGVTKAGRESLEAELEAFKRGYKSPSLVDGTITRTAKGLKETLAQGKQIEELKNFLAQNKKAYLSQMIEDGNLMEDQLKSARGMLDLMSDDEYIQMMVRSDTAAGKQIQNLIAKQAASGFGGREKIDEYAKILGMGIDERSAARNFMASKEAAGIVQPAQQALSQLTKKTGEKYRELEQKAASEFQGISPEVEDFVLDVEGKVQDIVENPEFFSSSFKDSLGKAFGILKSGKGPNFLKINKGEYTDVDDIERFNRLQKFKEVVRESIRPDVLSKKVGVKADVSERMASDMIGQVDDILRNSDDKIKANAIYSRMRDIEDFVFKNITRKGQVQREKIAGQLSKRQSAEQWREDLNDLRRWANDDIFSEEDREAVKKFLQVYDEAFQKAEDANLVKKFSWDAGPSSPGIQRFLSAVRNNTEIQDLLQNPAKAVAEIDNFSNSYLKQLTGKDKFGDLSELEQRAFVRAQNWFKKEVQKGIVSPQSLVDNYQLFLKKLQKESAKGGGSGKFFSGQNVKEDIKDALTNYIGTKIGTAGLNELAKAAGSEQGINVFEPLKEDFKKYLMDEYKLTDTQAGMVVKVLPDNPLELMGMLPRRTMARMGDVIKFPKEKQEPLSRGQKAAKTKFERDELQEKALDEINNIGFGFIKKNWPYREYPKTPTTKTKPIGDTFESGYKVLEGGEPLDFETFAQQMEKGTAKQNVFDTFNPNISERERELNKFRLFRTQAQSVDKLEQLKNLKKEFEKGGKYESIKDRKKVIERINSLIRSQEQNLQKGGRYKADEAWNPSDSELDAMMPFQSFIPPEMLKKYLQEQKPVTKSSKPISKKDLYKEVYVNPDEYTANYNPEFTISSESLPKPSRNGGFVYRIEDDKGLGPWHGGPKGKEAQWWMDDPSSQKKLGALDDPKLRALSDVIEDSEQSGQLLFAFNSLNQLKKHISPTEIKRLKDAGFSIKKIKADEVWEGQNEVVFTPDTGKWQGERKYRSDDEDY